MFGTNLKEGGGEGRKEGRKEERGARAKAGNRSAIKSSHNNADA